MWSTVVRHLLLPACEALLGRPTLSILQDLQRSGHMNRSAVAKYQQLKLDELVLHALAATPYWRERGHREHLGPTAAGFPLLTRAEIARHRDAMRWADAPARLFLDTSSGTTDGSLVFYVDRVRQAWDRSLRLHALARLGIEPGERQMHIWPEYRGGTFGRLKAALRGARDRLTNDPVCDLRPMTAARFDAVLDAFDRWRPAVVFGYPSWLHMLAQHRLRRRASRGRGWTPRRVVSTAELLYDFQRAPIEAAFGAPVTEEYGSQGVGLIASEDSAGRWQLHWQHVHLELRSGSRATQPGEFGEIVATNLHSHAMPFIRFATGDVARMPLDSDDGDAAAASPTLPRIAGRTSDLLVAEDGRLQDNRELVDTLVRETGLCEFGLHQPTPERLVCLTLDDAGSKARRGSVTEVLRSMLGRSLQVDWLTGSEFVRSASGKRRYVCSPVGHALLAHDDESGRVYSERWPERLFASA